MINIELRLLATMLYTGDFSPIKQHVVTADHFLTEQGKIVYDFISGFYGSTDGVTRYPSLAIVQNRFDGTAIELPTPDPADRVDALAHETVLQKVRADMKSMASELSLLSAETDPLAGVPALAARLKRSVEHGRRSRNLSLSGGFMDVLAEYDIGNILPQGIEWPWPLMNAATRGLQKKEFIVIAGRPKSRKTFTALAIGAHCLRNEHKRVLVFTPEMPPKQMLIRFIATMCSLRYTEFKNSALDIAEQTRLLEAANCYGKYARENDEAYSFRMKQQFPNIPGLLPSLDIVQSTGKTVSWMVSQIEMHEPDVVIADSFYRQAAEDKRHEGDWRGITSVSRALKDAAMETNVVMIGTHQMNRGSEDKLGTLSNMALADAVGQDADLIVRVVTGKIENHDRSALLILGGREVPFDGIMINNKPCYDFSEIGEITDRRQVMELLGEQDEEKKSKKGKVEKVAKKAAKNLDKEDTSAPEQAQDNE